MQINSLTATEENLMQLLWTLDSFYMRDVIEQHPEPKPHQNTISTYLKILVEKNFLTTQKEGRIFKYQVAVPLEDYKKQILQNFIAKFYNNSGKEILKFLFDEKLISNTDLMDYFNLKIEIKPQENQTPSLELATEVLKSTKDKKKKKKDKKK